MLEYRDLTASDLETAGKFFVEVLYRQADQTLLLSEQESNGYTYEDQ
jgi:hypothetical protein